MLQLTKLRKEIHFNAEIGEIVNVLKGVASAEFYRLYRTRRMLDEFGRNLEGFFQMVNVSAVEHLFLKDSSLPLTIVVITSDAGFLGKLNISVVRQALEQCLGQEKLIIVGRQGAQYIQEAGRDFVLLPGISDAVHYQEANRLTNFLIKSFFTKKIGRTIIVYPHFISFAAWEVRTFQLLPCRFLFPKESIPEDLETIEEEKILIEPTKNKVVDYLVKIWISYILYGIFWESKLSEWAARVIHLEGSSNEIGRLEKKLHRQYFRRLHEISDTNIREVFASKLAAQKVK